MQQPIVLLGALLWRIYKGLSVPSSLLDVGTYFLSLVEEAWVSIKSLMPRLFFVCSTELDLVYVLTELFSIKWDADCAALVASSCLWWVHTYPMLLFALYRSPRSQHRFTESHILHWALRTIFIFYHCCPVFSRFFGGGRYLKPWVCM